MKIKFLLAVMLLAAVNVFAQTPTFSSISGPILPNDIVTINGTNLIGVTKVVLKWNDPSNTNTLTITPYSVTSTAISFIVPDTSFFWYAHYNFYNSIDFVKIFVTKGSQSINTNFTSYLRHNGPVFTTIFSNANGENFRGKYLWDDWYSFRLTDDPQMQLNQIPFVQTYRDSMTIAGNFNYISYNLVGNCSYFNYLIYGGGLMVR